MALWRTGTVNNATPADINDERSMFLVDFTAEALTAYEENNVMRDLIQTRMVKSAKEVSFPCFWKTGASYFTPGTTLTGSQAIKREETRVPLDRMLLSDTAVTDEDAMKDYFDVDPVIAREQGAALARQFDKHAIQTGIMAARAPGRHGGDAPAGGSETITKIGNPDEIINAIALAKQKFLENDVPTEDLHCVLPPAQYTTLLMSNSSNVASIALNRDFGGMGSVSQGIVGPVHGVKITQSNNVPMTDLSASDASGGNVPANEWDNTVGNYHADFTKTRGLIFRSDAVVAAILKDMSAERERLTQNMYALYVTSILYGMAPHRNEAAKELIIP